MFNSWLHNLFKIEWCSLSILWNLRLNKWLYHVSFHLYLINYQATSLYGYYPKPSSPRITTLLLPLMESEDFCVHYGISDAMHRAFCYKSPVMLPTFQTLWLGPAFLACVFCLSVLNLDSLTEVTAHLMMPHHLVTQLIFYCFCDWFGLF